MILSFETVQIFLLDWKFVLSASKLFILEVRFLDEVFRLKNKLFAVEVVLLKRNFPLVSRTHFSAGKRGAKRRHSCIAVYKNVEE